MLPLKTAALAALGIAAASATALAEPGSFASIAGAPVAATPVFYGYGPAPYGYGPSPYGTYRYRYRRFARPNGTGYRGRGTRTGGPVGGLPGRS